MQEYNSGPVSNQSIIIRTSDNASNVRPNDRLLRLAQLANSSTTTVGSSSHVNLPSYEDVTKNIENKDYSDVSKADTEITIPPPTYDSVIKTLDTQSVSSASQLPQYNDVAVTDAPPTYHSIFTDSVLRVMNPFISENVETQQIPSNNVLDYGLTNVLLTIFIIIVLIAFVAVLPISMIIIGITYIHDCPVQPRIPIYLIVLGFFQMLECCGRLGYKCVQTQNTQQRNAWRERYRRKDPLVYFVIVWFIIGSMWVYQTNPECQNCHIQSTMKTNQTRLSTTPSLATVLPTEPAQNLVYCDMTVYKFAFWVITTYYSIIVFFCFLILVDVIFKGLNRCCNISR